VDLFYRLNVFPLEVPPLRERRADIPLLVAFFLSRFSKRFDKRVDMVSPETMERLTSYGWPGNIRELQNVIERAVVLSRGPVLELDRDLLPLSLELPKTIEPPAAGATAPGPSGLPTLEEIERRHILTALERSGGVIEGPRGAARLLDLHPNTLRSRMLKLGIRRRAHEIS